MKTFKFNTQHKQILADTITPVSVYLKLRDKFPNSLLLESSDYHANDNSFSYICCNPIAFIKVENEEIIKQFPDNSSETISITKEINVANEIQQFASQFESDNENFKFITNGLFGYVNFDAVRYFEKTKIDVKSNYNETPDIFYAIYQNIIAINHFKNEAFIFCHSIDTTNNIDEFRLFGL